MIDILTAEPGTPVYIGDGIAVTVFVRGNTIKLGVKWPAERRSLDGAQSVGRDGLQLLPPGYRNGSVTRS